MNSNTPDLQLDAATEKELDKIFAKINEALSIGEGVSLDYYLKDVDYSEAKAKAAIARLLIQSQTNAVAWTVGVVDDIHGLNGRIDTDGRLDRTFKGVKNTIRDRYKAEVGVDPAPSYPINAQLQAQLEKEEYE